MAWERGETRGRSVTPKRYSARTRTRKAHFSSNRSTPAEHVGDANVEQTECGAFFIYKFNYNKSRENHHRAIPTGRPRFCIHLAALNRTFDCKARSPSYKVMRSSFWTLRRLEGRKIARATRRRPYICDPRTDGSSHIRSNAG